MPPFAAGFFPPDVLAPEMEGGLMFSRSKLAGGGTKLGTAVKYWEEDKKTDTRVNSGKNHTIRE